MGARPKLNQAFVTGSVLLAGLIGLVTESWLVFGVALVLLVGLNLYAGDIRPRRPRR